MVDVKRIFYMGWFIKDALKETSDNLIYYVNFDSLSAIPKNLAGMGYALNTLSTCSAIFSILSEKLFCSKV